MNELSPAALETIYLAVIGVITLYLVWNGWKQGIARQIMTLLAILGAYLVGWFSAPNLAPTFSFLRYPEPVTKIIAGVVAGLATYIAIRTLRLLLFKKTSDIQPGVIRTSYGLLGAVMGLAFGGILLFLSSDFIRLLGTIAQTHVQLAEQRKQALEATPGRPAVEEPNFLVKGLAKLGSALDQGSTGQFIKRYDPVPTQIYANFAKLALVVSNQDALERFIRFPGVYALIRHPKLTALQSDPTVAELLKTHSYLRLLRNEKVVALANDPAFAAEIQKVDFDAALSDAVKALPNLPASSPGTSTPIPPATTPPVVPPSELP